MKRTITLMLMLVALVGNVLAWEPVIKERHWFGVKEYESELYPYNPDLDQQGVGPRNGTIYWNSNSNELTSIVVERDYSNYGTHKYHTSTFNCWMDDSGDDPKPRFSVNFPYRWEVGTNDNPNYTGLGLKVQDSGNAGGGTVIHINHLNNGDKLVFEMYCVVASDNIFYMPFLMEGSIQYVPTCQDVPTCSDQWSWDGASNFGNPDGVSGEYLYTGGNDGTVSIKVPDKTVIRCITIIYNNNNYKKATTRIDEIHDSQNNKGYEMTITGSGVLEDKRGAVPYLTMRYGAENDMTVSKYLGTVNGEKLYATSSIVDESEILNPNSVQLQSPYRNRTEAQNRKSLVGKEITVFTANEDLSDPDAFNSIYPLYGNYYYFFPEVDGKFHVKFYCEGGGEHMCLWYKLDNGVPVPANDQVTLTKIKMSTDGGNNWTTCGTGGENSILNQNYYEYTAEFKKGGVYYMCSNPTVQDQQTSIPRLISYSFIPDFRLAPLWYVATEEEKASGTINYAAELNQDFTVGGTIDLIDEAKIKYEGNIASAEPYFDGKVLKFRNIKYKSGRPCGEGEEASDPNLNDGGAIIVPVECTSGKATFVLTIPYSAEKAVWAADPENSNHSLRVRDNDATRNPNGKEVKKWDFYSKIYNIGQYSDENSQLYNETHKADGLTADWINTFMNLQNGTEPIFKSVYDMEGDNADMLKETEGLLFFTETNELGIWNENPESSTDFQDRYIGLIGGGEFWIPYLKEGDRIVLKMGRWGNCFDDFQEGHIQIEGATDAIGQPISGDYVLGGSHKLDNGDQSIPYGEYHFISTGGHFKLKVTDVPLLKLYTIVIYRNSINEDEILTENGILGQNREVLYTDKDGGATKEMKINLHFTGLGEKTADLTNTTSVQYYRTGKFKSTAPSFTTDASQLIWSYSPAHDLFGSFRSRLGVKTKDTNQAYVTDYADFNMAVGYRETKTYPYTWDLTDLIKYAKQTGAIDASGNEANVSKDANNKEIADIRLWDSYGLRIQPEKCQYGTLFVGGSQLWADQTMFEETKGLGITHYNNEWKRNGMFSMQGDTNGENGGLAIDDRRASDSNALFYGFVVPQVAANQAVYVRATVVDGAKTSQAKYKIGSTESNFTYLGTAADNGDAIFAMAITNDAETADVEVRIQGYEVKKIAVSDDFKQVSSQGWATESRGRIIDPELTSYMTGVPFENLVITSINYADKTIGYEVVRTAPETEGTVIKKAELMPACTADGGSEAYILHNKNNAVVEILNGGFHLFVPDLHDYSVTTTTTGSESTTTIGGLKTAKDMSATLMKAQLNAGTVAREVNGYINFVLTDTWTHLKPDGTPYGRPETSEEAFYQVPKGGIYSYGHQGYLPVAKSEMANAPRFTFMFMGDDDTTGIDETISTIGEENDENATYYNLNGQKLNGRPTQRGIYIVNGKKIVKK